LLQPEYASFALRDEWRQPSDFELQSHHDEQVSLTKLQQKTRLGFNEVGILIAFGHRLHVDLVAAHFLRKRRQVRMAVTMFNFFAAAMPGEIRLTPSAATTSNNSNFKTTYSCHLLERMSAMRPQ